MSNLKLIAKKHKTPIRFLNSTILLYGVTLLTSVVTYRYIGPDFLGIWATFTTFSTLATFLRLGIVNGMNRELPYYLGKKNTDKAYAYAETTLAYTLFSILIIVVTGIVFFLTYDFEKHESFSDSYKFATIVFFFNVAIEPYSSYLSGTFRTNNSFDKLSNIQSVQALLRLITLLLVVKFGYNGFLCREAFMVLIGAILLHFNRPLPQIRPRFKWSCFFDLFKIGFNIFLASYLTTFVDTFPRLFLIKEGSTTELGLFSPVLVILGIVYLVPNTISNYLYPKFSYAYGNGESNIYFWKKLRQLLLLSLAIGVVFAIGVYVCIDYVIPFFPKYLGSVPYIKLMSIGMLFLGYKVCGIIFNILKLYLWMWISPIVYAIVMASSLFTFNTVFDDKLTVASVSLIVTNCCMLIYYICSTYYVTHRKSKME